LPSIVSCFSSFCTQTQDYASSDGAGLLVSLSVPESLFFVFYINSEVYKFTKIYCLILIIKIYKISPTLIDYNRLMKFEEVIILYFDIETKVDTKGKNSNKSVNFVRMKSPTKKKISELFKEIDSVLSKQR